jgi:predicted AlkP superfamily phosphohydrolase/phosphomutase/Flp pilus assembly protein TadD
VPSPVPAIAAEAAVESSDAPSRTKRPQGSRRAVIWIGFDGLDFEILDRLAVSGGMPNWKRLAAEGWTARLKSDYPLISPVLWTTAATGRTPDAHRVLDFQEVDPATGRKVPISGLSRAVPAVWNLASAAGRKVGVVGWWATHPAEEVDGFFVTDRVSPLLFEGTAAGAVYPTSLQDGVAKTAARESRVGVEDLDDYVDEPPSEIARALEAGGGMKDRVVALSRILGATRTTQRVARELYDRTLPDLTAVYFEGTDEVGHVFASFAPPRLQCPSVTDADVARFSRVADAYYAVADRILGQWMRRAEEDGSVLIVSSDHGFKWGDDRPCGFASGEAATAAFWHRPEGVLAAWGRGVKRGAPRASAGQMDVAPTVLALLDLPASPAMPGAVRVEAFEAVRAPARREAPAPVVRRVSAGESAAKDADEYAKKLVALGYLSASQPQALAAPGGERPGMTEGAWNNLGTYEMRTRGDVAAARRAFEKALELAPGYPAPMFNLAVLARDRKDYAGAEAWLLKAIAALHADAAPAVTSWAREYERRGQEAAARSLLARASRENPDNEGIARERALLLHRAGDCRGAAAALGPFESKTTSAQTLNDLALIQTCLRDRAAVERLLARSLELDPNQPAVAQALERVRRAD